MSSTSLLPIPFALQVKLDALLLKYQDIPCAERKYTVDEIEFMNQVTPHLERQLLNAAREVNCLKHENDNLTMYLIAQHSDKLPVRYSNY